MEARIVCPLHQSATWIARILISWGIIASLTAFVENATMLYCARFLLGVAEAGFTPGILLYLIYLVPPA